MLLVNVIRLMGRAVEKSKIATTWMRILKQYDQLT